MQNKQQEPYAHILGLAPPNTIVTGLRNKDKLQCFLSLYQSDNERSQTFLQCCCGDKVSKLLLVSISYSLSATLLIWSHVCVDVCKSNIYSLLVLFFFGLYQHLRAISASVAAKFSTTFTS